jgi:hypothetical protein
MSFGALGGPVEYLDVCVGEPAEDADGVLDRLPV